MIVDYGLGHTGSVHDSLAFQSTRTFKEHETVFAPGEWLWADSAYAVDSWCIAPFKRPARGELTPDQRTFNYYLSKVRLSFNNSDVDLNFSTDRFESGLSTP
jgi:hypothetical protein